MSNEQEKIDKLDERLKQLKHEKRLLLNRQKAKEKKENAKRMIDIAAIAEEVLNCQGVEPEKFRSLLMNLKKNAYNKNYSNQQPNKPQNQQSDNHKHQQNRPPQNKQQGETQ